MKTADKMLKNLNIFKNFAGLKAVFAVMTAYLLYDEISLFVSKPTLTSISRAHLGPEHFPEIRVCPVPAFLQSQLQSHGYMSSFDFSMGRMRDSELKAEWRTTIGPDQSRYSPLIGPDQSRYSPLIADYL